MRSISVLFLLLIQIGCASQSSDIPRTLDYSAKPILLESYSSHNELHGAVLTLEEKMPSHWDKIYKNLKPWLEKKLDTSGLRKLVDSHFNLVQTLKENLAQDKQEYEKEYTKFVQFVQSEILITSDLIESADAPTLIMRAAFIQVDDARGKNRQFLQAEYKKIKSQGIEILKKLQKVQTDKEKESLLTKLNLNHRFGYITQYCLGVADKIDSEIILKEQEIKQYESEVEAIKKDFHERNRKLKQRRKF